MNATLPLFQELDASSGEQPLSGASPPGPARGPQAEAVASAADRHLRAAWRLSRAMGRFRDRSPEQTRAGLAICHHLQALLAQVDERR
jgi:hypothetical protein